MTEQVTSTVNEGSGSSSSDTSSSTDTSTVDTSSHSSDTSSSTDTSGTDTPRKTLRDVVSSALDKHSKVKDGTSTEDSTEPDASTDTTTAKGGVKTTAQPAKEDLDPITGRKLEKINPPAGLTPALREKWASVPREMQKFWVDREKQMSQNFQANSEHKKTAQTYTDLVSPYTDYLKSLNTTADKQIKQLLHLDYAMAKANPQQRAQIFYNLMRTLRPDAKTLTELAKGNKTIGPVQIGAPKPQLTEEQIADKVIQQRNEKQLEGDSASAIQTFRSDGTKEFFDDVAPLMSRIMNSGIIAQSDDMQTMLQQAYDMACTQHPEIKAIVDARNTQKASQKQKGKPFQGGKPSSGGGTPNPVGAAKPKSLRDAVSMAFDKVNGS